MDPINFKKGTIKIRGVHRGEITYREVEGMVSNKGLGFHRAVNPRYGKYEITHLSSGYSMSSLTDTINTQREAIEIICVMTEAGDWTRPAEELIRDNYNRLNTKDAIDKWRENEWRNNR